MEKKFKERISSQVKPLFYFTDGNPYSIMKKKEDIWDLCSNSYNKKEIKSNLLLILQKWTNFTPFGSVRNTRNMDLLRYYKTVNMYITLFRLKLLLGKMFWIKFIILWIKISIKRILMYLFTVFVGWIERGM